MASPPLSLYIGCLFTSVGAGRIEGNPSEGISFLKPSQKGVWVDETEPPCTIFAREGMPSGPARAGRRAGMCRMADAWKSDTAIALEPHS